MTRRPVAQIRSTGLATRACICTPLLTVTFTDQQVSRVAYEHRGYCPMPHEMLDTTAYTSHGQKVASGR